MTQAKQPQGRRRNLKEEQRRAQIKDAAINLFSTKGYQQSTMDDLAEAAGVSKSLIYWYWDGKSTLLNELIDTCMEPYIDLLSAAAASETPFINKFHKLLWDFMEMFRNNDRLNKLVHFCSLHQSKNENENFAKHVNDHYQKVLTHLEILAEQAVSAGFLPMETDCEAMALLLLTLTEGHIYMSILENRMPPERVYASMVPPLLKSIGAGKRP
ncbi:MAG: TetR/AcrR family transcriptional regulator [Thermodesulfobacteriota bacterium]|nr:TetR/AcrR family transcriptional regulator [Thermodesulfobacteriota bacterium]